ncbi:hypothetical protein PGB90_002065 [Kerria lacca]
MGNTFKYHMHPDEYPYDKSPIEFDPLYGFPEGARKQKVARVSYAEIESMQPPLEFRDYCLHKVFEYKACVNENIPFFSRCEHKMHEYANCEYEELYDRMKDYERERRLLLRRKRILQKQKEKQQLMTAS